MEPTNLTLEQWTEIGVALRFFWIALGAALFAALNLFVAHAMLPSVIDTEEISAKYGRLRGGFYFAGFLGIAVWVMALVMVFYNLGWINDVYPRIWQ